MRPTTPRGFRDVLPHEAVARERIVRTLSEVFSSWGYDPVETPVVEVMTTLERAAGDLEGTAFRLIDLDGRLLALRPDMTIPIARLVASRMLEEPGPKRLRYCADVFREHESLRGQARQFTQAGIELIGAAGAAADAEVIALAVSALEAVGISDFTVAVGDVEVLFALAGAVSQDAAWRTALLTAAHERNLVTIDELTRAAGVRADAGAALRELVRARGGLDAIRSCRDLVGRFCEPSAVDELERVWSLLEAAGVAGRVMVDFGIVRSFDYYTGIVLEIYGAGLGVPLGAGGRYDDVLAAFDAPAPAVGFAVGLERLSIALAEQQAGPAETPPEPVVLVGGPPAAAFRTARELRDRGRRAALAPGLSGEDLVREARAGGMEALEAR